MTTTNTAAACKGSPNPDMFYDPYQWSDAAKVCAECPLITECRRAFADDAYAYAGGMDPHRRARWVREQGVTNSKGKGAQQRPSVTDAVKDSIRSLYADGKGIKLIARELDVARSTVQRFLISEGLSRTAEERLELQLRNQALAPKRTDGDATRRMVLKLLGEGYTTSEVAELVGITRGYVVVIKNGRRK